MTMTNQPTAAERIAAQMEGRAATLAALYAIANDPMDADEDVFDAAGVSPSGWDEDRLMEEARETLRELPLSVETTKTIRVLLSTGGPADGLNVELDRDGNVSRVVYWFADWFDYAETVVTDEDSGLYRYAEELAELEQEMGR